jgi:peptidase M1-like protein
MLRALALAIAATAFAPGATPGAPPGTAPGPQVEVANYEIEAKLDPNAKAVTGTAKITWTNPSTDTVPDLWFHLYLNAFRDRDSTFWRESRGQLRGVPMPEDGWGSIRVTALRLADGTDLLPALSYEAPDDGNPKDRTVARVALPQPVAPGGRVALDVAFTAALPKAYARTGYAGDYYLVAQWFPKLAVYEPAGRRGRPAGGWNAHQFHADSEFYADFGRYRVSMTVPSNYVVGATGVRTGRTASGATATYTYEQDRIHDFAWTASPRFVDITRRFVAARAVSEPEYRDASARLDRPIEQLRLGDVEVRLLLQPEHQPQAERYLGAAMRGLKAFGLAYGAYPYPTLTIVDPPEAAEGTGGMEYPTFFTVGTMTLFNAWPFDRIREPEEVVLHELAHQYFQGLVASNEFEEAWLDEGITTYVTAQVMDEMFGPDRSTLELAGLRLGQGDQLRLMNHRDRGAEMIRQPSWTYDESYGFNAYFRPALTLRTLAHLVGERTMARILRTYVERWRFGHPSSDDFYAVASEVAGRDLRPFFAQTIESPEVVDYELGTIRTAPGYTTVTARRYGALQMPVDVAFKFEGRPVERRRWDAAARTTRFAFTYDAKLEWADVDPDRTVALDVSWLNNGRRVAPDRRAPAAMTSRWLLAVQQVLGWLAF